MSFGKETCLLLVTHVYCIAADVILNLVGLKVVSILFLIAMLRLFKLFFSGLTLWIFHCDLSCMHNAETKWNLLIF